jgi:hypothetical protein
MNVLFHQDSEMIEFDENDSAGSGSSCQDSDDFSGSGRSHQESYGSLESEHSHQDLDVELRNYKIAWTIVNIKARFPAREPTISIRNLESLLKI